MIKSPVASGGQGMCLEKQRGLSREGRVKGVVELKGLPWRHATLYFRISSALTSLLMPGSSGAETSPSIIWPHNGD